MTVPEYLVTFEAAIRPLVAAIALGLIWIGATRMEGPAQSRYATAGALSVVLVAWLAVAQYLGSANAYFATSENAVPTVLFGLLIPLMTAAVGLRLSGRIASLVSAIPLHWIVAAQVYRIGGGIFLVLWADGRLPWQFALPAGIGDVMTGGDHGGNDVPGTGPPLGLRCAEPPHFILSAGDGPYFRSPAGPHAPWPSSVAAEAGERLDGPAGRGVIPLA